MLFLRRSPLARSGGFGDDNQVAASDPATAVGRERLSISVTFLVHGLVVATWVSRIPAVQSSLELSPAVLGAILLALAAGSILAMPLTGALIHRVGSRRLVTATSLFFCFALPLLTLPSSPLRLALSLFVFGAAAGAMDVAMNVEAAAFETRRGRPVMSSFHGLFSIGGMLGAALGGGLAQLGLSVAAHFMLACLSLATVVIVISRWLPEGSCRSDTTLAFRFTRELWLLGGIAFCVAVGEGAMADWTALYLRNSLATSVGVAALGYAVFSAFMAAGRFLGDHLTMRLGRKRLVQRGVLLAGLGVCTALLTPSIALALLGFGLVGAGFSAIIPIVFGAGARVKAVAPGVGVASVTTTGYFGFLIGPPLIGFSAQLTSLRIALALVAVLCCVAFLLARSAELSD